MPWPNIVMNDNMDDANVAPTHEEESKPWTRKFFTVWAGQAFSIFGSQLVQFALVWWLTLRTGSATVLAVATMMALIPQVAISPFAGALVDRWNRRRVMIGADGGIALATASLAALFALGHIEVWHIYALLFVRATGAAFHWPAMQASTTLMVPKEHLARIGGLNQALFGMAAIIAPPLGAVALAIMPIEGILLIDIGTAMVAIAAVVAVPIPQPVKINGNSSAKGAKGVLEDMKLGFSFIRTWPGALGLLTMAMMINFFFSPAEALMPILVTKTFDQDVVGFATMQSAIGVGLVLGGLTLGAWGGLKSRMTTALVFLAAAGASTVAVGLIPPGLFLLAVAFIFVTGFTVAITNGELGAIMQVAIPPDMQGRVLSIVGAGSLAMSPIGLAFAGPAADIMGVQAWYMIAGLATFALGVYAFFVPSIMSLESGRTAPGTDTEGTGAKAVAPSDLQADGGKAG